MDGNVIIKCRKQDESLVNKALERARSSFVKATGIDVTLSIDQNYLTDKCAGGIVASSQGGRIRCNNTLEARLDQAFERMLPTLRTSLFGPTPNRKFFD